MTTAPEQDPDDVNRIEVRRVSAARSPWKHAGLAQMAGYIVHRLPGDSHYLTDRADDLSDFCHFTSDQNTDCC